MGKFIYFNDTDKPIHIHTATKAHGTVCSMDPINPMEIRDFKLPKGRVPWVKVWSYVDYFVILVSSQEEDPVKVQWTPGYQSYFSAGDEAEPFCDECDTYLEDDFIYCPGCGSRLGWED